jgi:hypothetical protein
MTSTYLIQSRQNPSRIIRQILQRRSSSRPIQTAPITVSNTSGLRIPLYSHRNPIKRPHSQKLRQRARETRRQLQYNKQHKVENHDPFASIAIRYRAEHQRSHRSQHESYGDALRKLAQLFDIQLSRTLKGMVQEHLPK